MSLNKRRSSSSERGRSRSGEKQNIFTNIDDVNQKQRKDLIKKNEELIKKYFGYSNQDNPFGDYNLSEQFFWKKKVKKMKEIGYDPEEVLSTGELQNRQKFLLEEIERVKQKRLEREAEKAKQEEFKNGLIREREQETYESWLEKEKNFHLKQTVVRSEIRIQQNREQPIDTFYKILQIYKNLQPHDPKIENIMEDPYILLKNCNLDELKDMLTDIANFIILEDAGIYQKLWREFQILVQDKIVSLELLAGQTNFELQNRNNEYEQDIIEMFKGKTFQELEQLEVQINETLENSEFKIDPEYWDYVLKRIKIYKAKRLLKEYFLRHIQNTKIPDQKPKAVEAITTTLSQQEDFSGELSPYLMDGDDVLFREALDPEEDKKIINELRVNVLQKEIERVLESILVKSKVDNPLSEKEQKEQEEKEIAKQIHLFEKTRPDGPFEEKFDDQIPIEATYEWIESYKPRKPQYFNRVKLGYEWNKYNQTHYDHENPPPKVVQGYKFNIFYPDLLNRHETPQYFLEPTENKEFCLIRFHAGPPYLDIAFKILNQQWEFSDKHGFKCVFERGILHLYFNFVRNRYRS